MVFPLLQWIRAPICLAPIIRSSDRRDLLPAELVSEQSLFTTRPANPFAQRKHGSFDHPVMRTRANTLVPGWDSAGRFSACLA